MDANQSRRRIEVEQAPSVLADKHRAFEYDPLDKEVDCMRLLEVRPAQSQDDPLVCDLSHVAFGDRPQFDALSYRWGDEVPQMPILINDCRHYVRKNLWDALHYLRAQRRNTPIWVDAICINQSDIAERNRQVRIMHHIYERASIVLVWLGEEYGKYQNLMNEAKSRRDEPPNDIAATDDPAPSPSPRPAEKVALAGPPEEQEMVNRLYRDEYWRRVWIIQEIGQADTILVCFGTSNPIAWNDFIHLIRMHTIGNDGPIRLAGLRHERDRGSFTFRRLLADHRDAKSQDPRDKIYGLVGLAADAFKFPMDYNKPLIVVWSDVMHFTHRRGLLPEADIINFGALVKYLLMGSDCSPLQQILQPQEAGEPLVLAQAPVPFEIEGTVLARIAHVGPSTNEILSRLATVDDWNETIQETYAQVVGKANRESRQLIHAILRSSLTRVCFNHVSPIQWEIYHKSDVFHSCNSALAMHGELSTRTTNAMGPQAEVDKDGAPRLFQLYSRNMGFIPWKMGIASCEARVGDLVVWIPNVRQAVLVRAREQAGKFARLQIVGTAWVSEDVARVDCKHNDRLQWLSSRDSSLPLKMDASTIFILLAQLDGTKPIVTET